jgi:O-antigen/teichoic acid export membrane protein
MGLIYSCFHGIANKIGMDKAIAYSSAGRMFHAFAGIVSIFFIATFLTAEEQGFFYTFNSILAIQLFFELGFTGIMTQYVAHEAVHLQLNESSIYEGENKYKSRLAYLVRFCTKWYTVISTFFLLVVIIVGIVYFVRFDTSDGTVNWVWPWILLCVSTAIKLFQSPFTAIYTGLGKVKEMNEVVFYQQLIIPVTQWILFACGVRLYVVGISSLFAVFIWCFFVWRKKLWKILLNLYNEKITETVSYMKEIFPYQWKIAVSWISGYFIYQLFNPVLFATEGAVVAGQMGMTINVLNAIQAFAYSWQNTKVPLYSGMIELKQYKELDITFNKTLRQMIGVSVVLIALLYALLFILRETGLSLGGSVIADRFLSFLPLTLMAIPMLLNQYIVSWATYLRCHKQEPFLINSIVIGALCGISTFLFGKLFGLRGITIGYCSIITFLAFPWAYIIFKNKKNEWHG